MGHSVIYLLTLGKDVSLPGMTCDYFSVAINGRLIVIGIVEAGIKSWILLNNNVETVKETSDSRTQQIHPNGTSDMFLIEDVKQQVLALSYARHWYAITFQ